jgi:hypothetical protein
MDYLLDLVRMLGREVNDNIDDLQKLRQISYILQQENPNSEALRILNLHIARRVDKLKKSINKG